MAISLQNISAVTASAAPRILIYGEQGIGKTTLAAEFPDPIFVQVEDGTPGGVALQSFGHLKTFAEVMEAMSALYTDAHNFRTLVLDNLSEFQRLVFAETCARLNVKTIEAPGYGKGYKEADYVWEDFLKGVNALRRDRAMNIVLIAHSTVERFDDPATQSYSRYSVDLHDRGRAIIAREMDCILLVKQDAAIVEDAQGFGNKRVRAAAHASRWIYTDSAPGWMAKSRYDMPDKFPYEKGRGYASLAPFLPQTPRHPADAGAEV